MPQPVEVPTASAISQTELPPVSIAPGLKVKTEEVNRVLAGYYGVLKDVLGLKISSKYLTKVDFRSDSKGDYLGEYDEKNNKHGIDIYAKVCEQVNSNWEDVLGHELGHGVRAQLHKKGPFTVVEESFAQYVNLILAVAGDFEALTRVFKRRSEKLGHIFYPISQIDRYPDGRQVNQGAVYIHYVHQRFGWDKAVRFVHLPSITPNRMELAGHRILRGVGLRSAGRSVGMAFSRDLEREFGMDVINLQRERRNCGTMLSSQQNQSLLHEKSPIQSNSRSSGRK